MLTNAIATSPHRDCPVESNEPFVPGARLPKQHGKGESSQSQYSQAGPHPSSQTDTYHQERHGSAPPFCTPCTVRGPSSPSTRTRGEKAKRTDQSEHGKDHTNRSSDDRDAATHCYSSEYTSPPEQRHGGLQIDRGSAGRLHEGDTAATQKLYCMFLRRVESRLRRKSSHVNHGMSSATRTVCHRWKAAMLRLR